MVWKQEYKVFSLFFNEPPFARLCAPVVLLRLLEGLSRHYNTTLPTVTRPVRQQAYRPRINKAQATISRVLPSVTLCIQRLVRWPLAQNCLCQDKQTYIVATTLGLLRGGRGRRTAIMVCWLWRGDIGDYNELLFLLAWTSDKTTDFSFEGSTVPCSPPKKSDYPP